MSAKQKTTDRVEANDQGSERADDQKPAASEKQDR